MAENHHDHQEKPRKPSRLGLRATAGAGEIVEVQGGHIVRSTGRKDRHSKVCTAKGPRDRRVRLSAHTAIQFYDVQDRLGYDRPSKAVDWLIKKAKTAIDELAELPAWKPTNSSGSAGILNFEQNHNHHHRPDDENLTNHGFDENPDDEIGDNQMGNPQNPTFLNLDSNSIANTIKSFFPVGGASSTPPPPPPDMQFHHHFPPPPELLSRPTNQNQNQNQDLNLSLQSFQDPILHHHHQQPPPPHHHHHGNNVFFDGSGWPENHPGGFQRLVAWGGGGGGDGGVSSTGFVFGSPTTTVQPPPMFLQPLFGQPTNNQLFNYISQRGPLQSSNSPSVRAWVDPPQPPPSFSGGGEYSGTFPGFHVPARIQGEDDEEHDGISDKPSSASSDSRD